MLKLKSYINIILNCIILGIIFIMAIILSPIAMLIWFTFVMVDFIVYRFIHVKEIFDVAAELSNEIVKSLDELS